MMGQPASGKISHHMHTQRLDCVCVCVCFVYILNVFCSQFQQLSNNRFSKNEMKFSVFAVSTHRLKQARDVVFNQLVFPCVDAPRVADNHA